MSAPDVSGALGCVSVQGNPDPALSRLHRLVMTVGQDHYIGPAEASSCFVGVLLEPKKRLYEIAHNLFGLGERSSSAMLSTSAMSALLQLAFEVEMCFCAHYGLFGLPGLVIMTHFMAVVIYIVRMVALMPVWTVCRNRLNFDSTYITILLRHVWELHFP